MSRALVLMIGFLACVSVVFWNDERRPVSVQIAGEMVGEHWFRIELSGRHVGYMFNKTEQTNRGNWAFSSTTHFLVQDNSPNTITKRLLFSGRSPYEMLEAEFENATGDTTTVRLAPEGYMADIQRGTQTNRVPLDWSFGLNDFLGFESWLALSRPTAEQSHFVRDPDFEKLRIVQRTYQVLDENELGYLIQTSAMLAPTVTQLDHAYRPLNLSMSGVFDIQRAREVDAVAIKEMQSKTSYLFPVDQRLNDHTRVASLKVRVHNAPDLLPEIIRNFRGTTSQYADPDEHIGEELKYPVSARKVQALLGRVVANESRSEMAKALVALTHAQLEYSEDNPAGGVLDALARGYGECTDYADLLTTLARAGQIPARTVFGLAYRDGPNPVFMYHAWNELFIDKAWIAVDPTWNQTEIDATHIPLSDQQSAALMLAHSQNPIHFEVLGASYL